MSILDAVISGNIADIDIALSAKPQLETRYAYGKTLLHFAVESNSLAVAERLLRAGANANARNDSKETPLIAAAQKNCLLMTERLIAADAGLDYQNNNGQTALMIAAASGNLTIVNQLMLAGADPDLQDNKGQTALHKAVGKPEIMKILLESGANPDIQEKEKGWTALHMAVDRQSGNSITVLMEAGANPHILSGIGVNPSELSSAQSNLSGVKRIFDYTQKWATPSERKPRKSAARQPAAQQTGLSSQTQENIRRIEESLGKKRGGAEKSDALPASGNTDGDGSWTKASDSTMARISTYAATGYRLTEFFDFESRQYTAVMHNTETRLDTVTQREFDAFHDKTLLSHAFNAFAAAGGKADPRVIENGFLGRRKEPLIRPKQPDATPPSPGTGG